MLEVRAAQSDEEAAAAVGVLARAAFGAAVGRLVAYPRDSPHGELLVALGPAEQPVGAVCTASFGTTGWIGALGVAAPARGRGTGAALTEAAIAWLRARGAETILLYATPMGRPVYDRLGFVAEGGATAWRGSGRAATQAPRVALRALTETDRDDCVALDRATTGEDRRVMLDAVRPLYGVAACADGADGLRGFAAVSPWGVGTSIAADDPEAGVALMAAATQAAGHGSAVLVVPDENEAALRAMRDWGFARANHGQRMRLGPPVPWRPERQFGLFNLFWG